MKRFASWVRSCVISRAPRGTLALLTLAFGAALAPLPLAAQTPSPGIAKAFGAATIPLNGTTSLTFTLSNPNASPLTALQVADTFPAGLVIATPNGLVNPCSAGFTATAGTSSLSFAVATLAAGASCTFSVNVVGTTAGTKNNTVSASSGTNVVTSNASITVVAPPSITKVFNPSVIVPGATTSLTFTITNPAANSVALTGVAFNDTLPTGLTVANASATVCGGTLTTTAPTGIALSGATIAANSQCLFSITVTGAAEGNYTNTTGAAISTNGGTGNTATANLTVIEPPTITKAFGAASITLTAGTTLQFTYTNPNSTLALTGVAFTDTLPAGLVISTPSGLSGNCTPGSTSGTITSVSGTGVVSLSGATLAASGSCMFTVTNVTGTTAGVKNNSVTVTSTNGGTGNTSNASVMVTAPLAPTITKAFGAASIPLNGGTTLQFTYTNPNSTLALTGVAFTDTLPAGLVISTPSGLSGNCTPGSTSGTITSVSGTGVVSLSGATLAASGSCMFTVTNVTGTTAGVKSNSVTVTSTNGGTGNTASASLTVLAPPTISKAFGAPTIALGGSASLSFTITNPNATATLTGIGFSDPLPSGLTVAAPNGLTGSCGGGTITAVAGATSVSLSGATLAAGSSCTFAVNVGGIVGGVQNNVTGAVTSIEAGAGNTAAATLTVLAPSIPAPMLSGWSLLLLVLAFVAIGVRLGYRRARTR